MQIAVMGHCLNALLPPDQRTVEDRVRIAAEAGISHVEPFGGTWPADVDPRRTAERVRREGDRRGVSFPAFGSNTRLGEPVVGAGLVPARGAGTSPAPTIAALKDRKSTRLNSSH